jgi:hypothetical protein
MSKPCQRPYLAFQLFLALARHHSILLIIIEKIKDDLALFQLAQEESAALTRWSA